MLAHVMVVQGPNHDPKAAHGRSVARVCGHDEERAYRLGRHVRDVQAPCDPAASIRDGAAHDAIQHNGVDASPARLSLAATHDSGRHNVKRHGDARP